MDFFFLNVFLNVLYLLIQVALYGCEMKLVYLIESKPSHLFGLSCMIKRINSYSTVSRLGQQ